MEVLGAQKEETLAQAAERKAAVAEKDRQRQLLSAIPRLYGQSVTQGSISTPEVDGMPMFSQGSKVDQPSMQGPAKFDVQTALRLGLTPAQIKEYEGLVNLGKPKVARTIETMVNGRPVTLQVDEYGQPIGQGMEQWKQPMTISQGDRQSLVDPVSRQTVGSFPINMSPAEQDTSRRGWQSNNLAQQRLAFDMRGGADRNKPPQGYRWSADGSRLEAIPGGPAEKSQTATEGERKAATLLTRLEAAQNTLTDVVKNNPSAERPGLASFVPTDVGRNLFTSTDRQRVEAAQLDFLDAALTLGTGAAYTREQLEGYRKSYFPQIGDSAATIADKLARQEQLVKAARISAGRAESAFTPTNAPQPGIVRNGYRYKGGNPADQRNWEKL
jgi:hypothetical protein